MGWRQLLAQVRQHAGKSYAKVGLLGAKASAQHESGGPLTVVEVGLVHEFGSRDERIPERSFLREAFDGNREKYAERVRQLMGLVLEGKLDYARALGLLGAEAASDVKVWMTEGMFEPLAPSTIAKKGSAHPLIDTGQLRASVSFVVVRGDVDGRAS